MKSYLRFLSRNKLYTAIMAVGLSVAFGFIIIMSCYVWQQHMITRGIPNHKQKFVVSNTTRITMSEEAQILKDNIPEIESIVRFGRRFSNVITLEDWGKDLPAGSFYSADDGFFEMFPVKFIAGDHDCLNGGAKVAVCKEFADAHGGLDILGKLMTFNDIPYTITGIYEGFEKTSLTDTRYVVSLEEEHMRKEEVVDIVVRLSEGSDPETVNAKIQEVMDDYWKDFPENRRWQIGKTRSCLVNVAETYYSAHGVFFKKGSLEITVLFYVIVLLVLVSAIFNFINLQSALAGKRMNEIATRMSLGETKRSLIMKNLAETFLFVTVCFILGSAISIALEPYMNRLLAAEVRIEVSFDFRHILFYLLLISVVTAIVFVSGSLQITRINPIAVIKKEFAFRRKMTTARIFIGLQTVQAVMMISTVIVMQKQLNHMKNMPIGVETEGIFMSTSNGPIFERTLKSLPYVEAVGRSDGRPGDMSELIYENERIGMISCEPEVLKIFGLKVTMDFNPDSDLGVWMSESTYDYYHSLAGDDRNRFLAGPCYGHEIAGVYEDVAISPALRYRGSRKSLIHVKDEYGPFHRMYIKTVGDPREAMKRLEEDGKKYCKDNNLDYGIYLSSFEEEIEKEYSSMTRSVEFISLFMYVAIFLSILGLVGISRYYVMEQRAGIAVRKVFGGTIATEVLRNLKTYIAITSAATLIGIIPSVFIAIRYLESYSYRINLTPWIFVLTALIIMLISTTATFGQILSAAKVNPTDVLKKE